MTLSNTQHLNKGQLVIQNVGRDGRRTDAQMMEALQQAVAMSQAGESAPLLTTGDVAQRLGVSRQTAESWVKRGLFPTASLDGRTFVAPATFAPVNHVEYTVDELDSERQQVAYTAGNERMQQTRKAWTQRKQGKA